MVIHPKMGHVHWVALHGSSALYTSGDIPIPRVPSTQRVYIDVGNQCAAYCLDYSRELGSGRHQNCQYAVEIEKVACEFSYVSGGQGLVAGNDLFVRLLPGNSPRASTVPVSWGICPGSRVSGEWLVGIVGE